MRGGAGILGRCLLWLLGYELPLFQCLWAECAAFNFLLLLLLGQPFDFVLLCIEPLLVSASEVDGPLLLRLS